MKTFSQIARGIVDNPQILRDTLREAAPLASEEELDTLAQLFRTATNASTKKERAALLQQYRAELKKYQGEKTQQPDFPEFLSLDVSGLPEFNI